MHVDLLDTDAHFPVHVDLLLMTQPEFDDEAVPHPVSDNCLNRWCTRCLPATSCGDPGCRRHDFSHLNHIVSMHASRSDWQDGRALAAIMARLYDMSQQTRVLSSLVLAVRSNHHLPAVKWLLSRYHSTLRYIKIFTPYHYEANANALAEHLDRSHVHFPELRWFGFQAMSRTLGDLVVRTSPKLAGIYCQRWGYLQWMTDAAREDRPQGAWLMAERYFKAAIAPH